MSENTTNVFLEATKRKLRFITPNGHLSTEDLWDLPLTKLDEMAVTIDESLVGDRKSFRRNPDRKVTAQQAENRLRLDVLTEVIQAKEEDNARKVAAADKRARIEFLERLRDKKAMEQLEAKDLAEIEKELAELQEI